MGSWCQLPHPPREVLVLLFADKSRTPMVKSRVLTIGGDLRIAKGVGCAYPEPEFMVNTGATQRGNGLSLASVLMMKRGRAFLAEAIWYIMLRCSGVLNFKIRTLAQGLSYKISD